MNRIHRVLAGLALILLLSAFQPVPPAPASAFVNAAVFPEIIALPGVAPEGIASGNGSTFYAGSLTDGQIVEGDFRTGAVKALVGPQGHPILGLKFDSRSGLLFAAGGPSGLGQVFDSATGSLVATYAFAAAPPDTTINDVVVTRTGAYFTDSNRSALYHVGLGPAGQPAIGFDVIALPANFGVPGTCTVGPPLTGNGIVASPNGEFLILVHMSEGKLYRMDTATLHVVPINVSGSDMAGGAPLCTTDGMLLQGHTLYVVQNFLNRVAVVEMSPNLLAGAVTRYLTEPFASKPDLQVPTTIAEFGDHLYAVTAGFAPPSPDFVVRINK